MEIFYDAFLVLSALFFVAGVALIVWGCIARFEAIRILLGIALLLLSPVVLLLWERLAWEPFAEHLSKLS